MRGIDSFIHSNLFRVRFAGFMATGIELQNQGWEFSAYQQYAMDHAGYDMQLIMKHGGGVTLASRLTLFDLRRITQIQPQDIVFETLSVQVGDRSNYFAQPKPFEIDFTKKSFSAIDATPYIERVDLSKIDFNKFGVFKKINDAANIFLPEKTINELMDEILTKQKPIQDEIRKNRKREQFMQEFNRNPNEDIKVQLVAV